MNRDSRGKLPSNVDSLQVRENEIAKSYNESKKNVNIVTSSLRDMMYMYIVHHVKIFNMCQRLITLHVFAFPGLTVTF